MKVYFVTSNKGKLSEAQKILEGFEIVQKDIGYPEIQAETCEEVVRSGIAEVFKKVKAPVMIEDSGLFIEALNGFPGTFSAQIYKKLGCHGILKLLKDQDNRNAKFISSVAYQTADSEALITSGIVTGRISFEQRGEAGFGYDPIVIPDGYDLTFAELGDEKNKVSHRWQALKNLKNQLKKK